MRTCPAHGLRALVLVGTALLVLPPARAGAPISMWGADAAWQHDASWPDTPASGGAPLQADPPFLMLTGADPQDGWPLPVESVAPREAFPGIEVPALPHEFPIPPLKDTWDRSVERVHATRTPPRVSSPSGGNSWLVIALGGAFGTIVMSAMAFGLVRAGR